MEDYEKWLINLVLIILFFASAELNFFPVDHGVGKRMSASALFPVGSTLYPYARIAFPVAFVALYLVRRRKKQDEADELIIMTEEQERRIFGDK